MGMSKKNYEEIAEIIKSNYENCAIDDAYINELVDYFKKYNPRFDRDKFLKACGVKK